MRVGRVAGDAHRQVLFRLTEHLHTKSVRQQQVVCRRHRLPRRGVARGVIPSGVGQE